MCNISFDESKSVLQFVACNKYYYGKLENIDVRVFHLLKSPQNVIIAFSDKLESIFQKYFEKLWINNIFLVLSSFLQLTTEDDTAIIPKD